MSRRKRKSAEKTDLVMEEFENPYFQPDHPESRNNPRKIMAMKNVRESAIETLYSRGKLDLAQKKAADRFRGLWESCGGTVAAMDYGREPVDGGGAQEPISERQVQAGRELKRCRDLLGARLYHLVGKVCGQGYALQEISRDDRARRTAADNLRDSLDDLAEMWGIMRRSVNNRAQTVQ